MPRQIYYDGHDKTGQSQLAAAVCLMKYPSATIHNTDAGDNTAMAAFVSALSDNTQDEIFICMPLKSAHAAGHFTVAQAYGFQAKLKTALRGTDVTGDCQDNADATDVVLEAADNEADDYYNQRIVKVIHDPGGTPATEYRLILDYTTADDICVCGPTDFGTVSDDDNSDTYTIVMSDYLHFYGETIGSNLPAMTAFDGEFSGYDIPLLLTLMNQEAYAKNTKTATGIAAGTLSDTGEFTLNEYTGKNFYVFVESSSVNHAGLQIRKIASNTADTLTLSSNWTVTPDATCVYSIMEGYDYALWDLYLKYAIATYLYYSDNEINEIRKMMDKYGELALGRTKYYQDLALMEEYAEKGQHIAEGIAHGVSTAA